MCAKWCSNAQYDQPCPSNLLADDCRFNGNAAGCTWGLCDDYDKPWPTRCGWKRCGACAQCVPPSPPNELGELGETGNRLTAGDGVDGGVIAGIVVAVLVVLAVIVGVVVYCRWNKRALLTRTLHGGRAQDGQTFASAAYTHETKFVSIDAINAKVDTSTRDAPMAETDPIELTRSDTMNTQNTDVEFGI